MFYALGSDPGEEEVCDTAGEQDPMDVGSPEASLPRLVDDDFAGPWRQLVYDIVTILASDQQPAHRTLVADT